MMENLANKDFYGFLEPFAPVIDDVEFTQQQIAAVKVWKAWKKIILLQLKSRLILINISGLAQWKNFMQTFLCSLTSVSPLI